MSWADEVISRWENGPPDDWPHPKKPEQPPEQKIYYHLTEKSNGAARTKCGLGIRDNWQHGIDLQRSLSPCPECIRRRMEEDE